MNKKVAYVVIFCWHVLKAQRHVQRSSICHLCAGVFADNPSVGRVDGRLVRQRRGLVLRGLGDGSDCVVRHCFVSTTPARIRCSPLPRTRNLWMAAKLLRPFIHPLPLLQIPPTNCSGGEAGELGAGSAIRSGSVEAPSCVRGVRAEGGDGAGGVGREDRDDAAWAERATAAWDRKPATAQGSPRVIHAARAASRAY